MSKHRKWLGPALAIALAIVLGVGTTIALAEIGIGPGAARRCTPSALSGRVVDVTVTDMGMMGSGMMGGHHRYPNDDGPSWGTAPMRMFVEPAAVAAGEVSLRVHNTGMLTHEVVVLPLTGQVAGTRTVGSDDRVDEAGSLGESSKTCGSGAGDGIAPHALSWTTLTLPAGRYELVCNLPGHYRGGAHVELDVTASNG